MALSAYEEQQAAEIEAELRGRDDSWSRKVDVLVAELEGRRVPRVLPIVCLLGGIVILVAGRQDWLSTQLAILIGLPASWIRIAFTVGACMMTIAGAMLLARTVYDRHRRRAQL